jgi:hypothetical protein
MASRQIAAASHQHVTSKTPSQGEQSMPRRPQVLREIFGMLRPRGFLTVHCDPCKEAQFINLVERLDLADVAMGGASSASSSQAGRLRSDAVCRDRRLHRRGSINRTAFEESASPSADALSSPS